MTIFSLYTWAPAVAPVNIAFAQPELFAGSGYPSELQGRAYVSQFGGTFAVGPGGDATKNVSEYIVPTDDGPVSRSRTIARYNGVGTSTVVALAAGPDGMYFSDFFSEFSFTNPTARGASIFRIRWVGLPPPPDCDGDGLSDAEEIAAGTSQDCNGNGIPDECDIAALRSIDCDGDGVPDECEISIIQTTDFEDQKPGVFQLNGAATIINGEVRLTPALTDQIGTAIHPPLTVETLSSLDVAFDFRIGNGSGADGICFSAFDAALYPATALFSEQGPGTLDHTRGGPGTLVVKFDTFDNDGSGENLIELLVNADVIARWVPPFDLEDNVERRARIVFRDGRVTVRIDDPKLGLLTVFESVAATGLTPFVARLGFAGRTGGLTNEHYLDNISFSVPGPADADQDGFLDICQIPGDMNCDRNVNFDDIDGFVTALTGAASYRAAFPNCRWLNGDIDGSGAVSFDDIDGLVACVISAGCL